MARWFKKGMVLALGLGVVPGIGPAGAMAQVFERDTKVTGPRGRSLERDIQIHRGPAGIERDITIRRPGGTFQQETFLPRPHGHGGGWGPGPRGPIIVNGGGGGMSPLGAGLLGGALGAGAGLLIGSAISQPPPPPPVFVAPGPVYVTQPLPPPVVEYVPPVRYQPAPPQTAVVVDPVAQEIARFQSNHEASRRDAAVHLGRMGDARAVMPLVDRLKNDRSREVRMAAATALGQIGDPGASVYLERSIIYDPRQDVRDASTVALSRLRQAQDQAAIAATHTTGGFSSSPVPTTTVPSLSPTSAYVPPPPRPANGPR